MADSPSVDGQGHDRMEGTAAETSVATNNQRGNGPDMNHPESGINVAGQAHDRIDTEMDNSGASPHGETPEFPADGSSNLQDNGTSEEPMDTTPDNPLAEMPMLTDGTNSSTRDLGTPPKAESLSCTMMKTLIIS